MDVDSVAGELYGLPPDEFTPARDARAGQARDAGDRELAAAIKKLRRPTVGAWLANLVARERPDQVAELLDLGGQMRQAQAELAGNELRHLSQQRRQLVTGLVEQARLLGRESGRPVSDASARELEATLEAAVADPGAAGTLRQGRLTAALRYAGFGSADLAGFAAAPSRPASETAFQPPPRQPAKPDRSRTDRRSREHLQAAQRELRAAEAAAVSAGKEAAKHERRLRDTRAEHNRLNRQVADLERRLRDLRAAEQRAMSDLQDAEQSRDTANAKVQEANDRAARARTALDQLTTPGG